MIVDCITYYENELVESRKELSIKGERIEHHAATLPSITELRYSQLQDIEAILEYLNIQYKKVRSSAFKKYTTSHNKALTSRDAEKYVDGDDSVIESAMLINRFALLRNQYLAVMKGIEAKHWEITNIVKLRCAGIEDARL
jgi:hypothetical protein